MHLVIQVSSAILHDASSSIARDLPVPFNSSLHDRFPFKLSSTSAAFINQSTKWFQSYEAVLLMTSSCFEVVVTDNKALLYLP